MRRKLSDDEKWVRGELSKLYPQLNINEKKVLGAGYDFYGGDLLAVAIEFFLNKPLKTQIKAFEENTAENFITFIMNLQAKSKTSFFYRHYKKFSIEQRVYFSSQPYDSRKDEDDSDDDLMICIKNNLEDLDPYEKMLVVRRAINKETFVEISESYNIPYSALASDYRKVIKKLKQLCQHLR